MSKGSYDVRKIREALPERKRRYLLFCHAFSGCYTVSAIAGYGKKKFIDRFCAGGIDEYMSTFLDMQSTKDAVIKAGVAIFKYICHASGATLGAIRCNMFSKKAACGVITPETLPPTEGAAVQHSLCAYLQSWDWILLQSMSLVQHVFGSSEHGNYETVPTLYPMTPDELLQFTSCNCNRDCSNRWCSCKKNGVKCISACGRITFKNCVKNGVEYGKIHIQTLKNI